jgi:hypothetical protein
VALSLSRVSPSVQPTWVKVANEQVVKSCSELLQANWSVQGYLFHSNLKVLHLQCFDMVIGMEWLSIPNNGTHVTLQGLIPRMLDCNCVELLQLSSLSKIEPVIEMPATMQDILDQFQSVFAEHAELPPRRVCDHKIPFILGGTPTHARPYRYALAMKDEIEKQVKEMLQAGVIQPSTKCFLFSNATSQEEGRGLEVLH